MKNVWLDIKSYRQVLGKLVQYNGNMIGMVVQLQVLKEKIILVVENIADQTQWSGPPEVFGL